jgi:hypothetical protein
MGDDSVGIVEFFIVIVKLLKVGKWTMTAFPHRRFWWWRLRMATGLL